MKNYAYKSLLTEARDMRSVLPVSPNTYSGTEFNKLPELITKGAVKSTDDFNRIFEEEVKSSEINIQKLEHTLFIHFQNNIKHFQIGKIILDKHLKASLEQPEKLSGANFYPEKWFELKDRLMTGKIDLVVEGKQEAKIIDFRIGAITQNTFDKKKRKEQIKLYAHLYLKNACKFPTALNLVDLTKQKFFISFFQSECNPLSEEIKELINITNTNISTGSFATNPTGANYKYCLHKLSCSFFPEQTGPEYSFNDISGSVKKSF